MKRSGLLIVSLGYFLVVQPAVADWTPAKRLTWTSGWSMVPAIAKGASNTVYVVWEDDTPGYSEIYFKRSTDGGTTWGPMKRLTWTLNHSWRPAVAAGSGGVVVVVWEEHDDTGQGAEIYYRRSPDAGATWGAAQKLTWTSNMSGNPAIASAAGSAIHVAWESSQSGDVELYTKMSADNGATWSASKRLTWTSGLSIEAAVAMDTGNGAHVVWEDDTSGGLEIYYKGSPDGGSAWGAAKRLTWSAESPDFPDVAADSGGGVHVVWRGGTPANYEVFYKSSPDGGASWSAMKRLTWTSGGSEEPAIAVGLDNIIRLVWQDDFPGNSEIYHKKSVDGGANWSSASRLTFTSGHSGIPSLAVDSKYNVHIVWYDDTPGNFEIYYMKGQ